MSMAFPGEELGWPQCQGDPKMPQPSGPILGSYDLALILVTGGESG